MSKPKRVTFFASQVNSLICLPASGYPTGIYTVSWDFELKLEMEALKEKFFRGDTILVSSA